MPKPYLQHLNSSKDLETTYEAIRAGFVALALEKNRRATPFVAEARALKAAASKAKAPAELLRMPKLGIAERLHLPPMDFYLESALHKCRKNAIVSARSHD